MSQITESLQELFASHGIACALQGTWVIFPEHGRKATAEVVREIPQPNGMTVQLDVLFEIAAGRMIAESFAGIGANRESAISDALKNFAYNSFHVLLAAFLRPEEEDAHVSREAWSIGGVTRAVTVGNLGVRGTFPASATGEQLIGCFERFKLLLQAQALSPETHWLRLYYAQVDGRPIASEALLDNESQEALLAECASFDWPRGEAFYGARLFLVIHGEDSQQITPERAVTYLIEWMTAHPAATDEAIYPALIEAGIPAPLANRAYSFTQAAWGHLLLEGMKVNTTEDYFCFDAAGRVVETGRLADEPCFAAAARLSSHYLNTAAFKRLALASASVQAANNALKSGAQLEHLVMAPMNLFLEAPTPAGMQNAQKAISEYIAAHQKQQAPLQETAQAQARPARWRFWKR